MASEWTARSALERLALGVAASKDRVDLLHALAEYLSEAHRGETWEVWMQSENSAEWSKAAASGAPAGARTQSLDPSMTLSLSGDLVEDGEMTHRGLGEDAVLSCEGRAEDDEAAVALIRAAWPRARGFEDARRLVTVDEASGLYNARHLWSVLEQELARCRRFKRRMALLFVDLDYFKEVNDALGHMEGTQTLAEVGRLLLGAVRRADHAFRYGGDEFALCLVETGPEEALEVAERIRVRLAQWASRQTDARARVTASIGVSSFPDDGDTPQALVQGADAAMYRAKQSGRDGVRGTKEP